MDGLQYKPPLNPPTPPPVTLIPFGCDGETGPADKDFNQVVFKGRLCRVVGLSSEGRRHLERHGEEAMFEGIGKGFWLPDQTIFMGLLGTGHSLWGRCGGHWKLAWIICHFKINIWSKKLTKNILDIQYFMAPIFICWCLYGAWTQQWISI